MTNPRKSGAEPAAGHAARRRPIREAIGPGVITGAADDDPSGVATYSQAGAQFGFGLLWTTVRTAPLMVGIQLASARVGWVAGSAVLNGLVAVPIMAALMVVAARESIMGELRIGARTRVLGWAGTAVMLLAAVAMLTSLRA
jgi:Mn2+/Fe2+ NRAMP family transporter